MKAIIFYESEVLRMLVFILIYEIYQEEKMITGQIGESKQKDSKQSTKAEFTEPENNPDFNRKIDEEYEKSKKRKRTNNIIIAIILIIMLLIYFWRF